MVLFGYRFTVFFLLLFNLLTFFFFFKHLYRITFRFKIYIFPSLWYRTLSPPNSSIHSLFQLDSDYSGGTKMYNVFLKIRSRLCFGCVWEKNKSTCSFSLTAGHLVLPYTRDAVSWRCRLVEISSSVPLNRWSNSCLIDLISETMNHHNFDFSISS